MSKTVVTGLRTAIGAGVLCMLAGSAHAGLSQIILEIHAEVNGQVATFAVPQSAGSWSGSTYNWQLAQPVALTTATGVPLGYLEGASVFVIEDPVVAVNFNIASTNLNTIFSISSPLLSFPTIANAVGTASAAVSVTDLGGDGATLTPIGTGAYSAQYNGLVPFGTEFASLLNNPVIAAPFSTANASAEFPGGGNFVPIAGAVDDISAQWHFVLSPNDIASGTGVFTVVPAPASLTLIGLGGMVAGRRRR